MNIVKAFRIFGIGGLFPPCGTSPQKDIRNPKSKMVSGCKQIKYKHVVSG